MNTRSPLLLILRLTIWCKLRGCAPQFTPQPKTLALLIFVMSLVSAACAGGVTPPGTQGPPITQTPPLTVRDTPTPDRYPLEDLLSLAPSDILLQQDYLPGLMRPEVQYAFGRVAPFTLFADGTLIYDQEGMMQAQLTPQEGLALLQRVLDLGFGRLDSYTDSCRPTGETSPEGGKIIECVMDAGTAILRARLPGEDLREVRVYGEFANDLEALKAIQGVLSGYTNPQARPYIPEKATLFINSAPFTEIAPVGGWPLDPGRLAGLAPETQQAWVLEGDELAAFLAAVPRNMGDFAFEFDGRVVNTFLVPWLPGVDHSAAIGEAFPPPPGKTPPGPPGTFAGCPETVAIVDSADFRVAYVSMGNVWLLDEGAEGRSLTDTGDVRLVKISPDGERVVFVRQVNRQPASLWAVDVDGSELRELTTGASLTGELEILAFSDAHPLVAFSHQVDRFNAELWVAGLDGSGLRRLASAAELKALLDEPGIPPAGASPVSVQWIPGEAILTYDAYPNYDGDGIYIYVQRLVASVDAISGQQSIFLPRGEGGRLSFSPDGSRAAVITPDSLAFIDLKSGERRPVGVAYAAMGMGEFYFYPPLAWEGDSNSLLLVQPEGEAHEPVHTVTLWRVPVDGTPAVPLSQFQGDGISTVLSPDQSMVAYRSAFPPSNHRELHIARVDGSEDILYAAGNEVEFLNWTPDSQRFVYQFFDTGMQYVGNICGEPIPMSDTPMAIYPTWLDPLHFLYTGVWERSPSLAIATPGGFGGLPLAVSEGEISFDFIAFPVR